MLNNKEVLHFLHKMPELNEEQMLAVLAQVQAWKVERQKGCYIVPKWGTICHVAWQDGHTYMGVVTGNADDDCYVILFADNLRYSVPRWRVSCTNASIETQLDTNIHMHSGWNSLQHSPTESAWQQFLLMDAAYEKEKFI